MADELSMQISDKAFHVSRIVTYALARMSDLILFGQKNVRRIFVLLFIVDYCKLFRIAVSLWWRDGEWGSCGILTLQH